MAQNRSERTEIGWRPWQRERVERAAGERWTFSEFVRQAALARADEVLDDGERSVAYSYEPRRETR